MVQGAESEVKPDPKTQRPGLIPVGATREWPLRAINAGLLRLNLPSRVQASVPLEC